MATAQPSITLYHYWRSSSSWRIRWGLELARLKYQSQPVNLLKDEQRSAEYLRLNPAGFVPCLVVDGKPMTQSLAILEWLEESFPCGLLPSDRWARFQARKLSLIIAADTQPLQNPKAQKYFSIDADLRKSYTQYWIREGLKTYEAELQAAAPGTFSVGDSVTMADLCLIPQVYNARRFEVDMGEYPLIRGIAERAQATPACEKAAPHNQSDAQ